MRSAARLAVLGVVAVSWGCGSGSSGGGSPPPVQDPPPATCKATLDQCATAADCCGTCFSGFCFPSQAGGKCVTTNDCGSPNVCTSRVCTAAACRQDADVCSADGQCCGGHCRPNGVCGANRAPVAVAGAGGSVHKRQVVTLGGSTDPDGDALTYSWSLAAPPGSAASLSSTTAAAPSFVTDLVGSYVATVTVSDGRLSATASATYTAFNSPPVAAAGLDRTVARNTAVQVSGSGSDPDADPLTFTWSLAGPAGSAAALVDLGSGQASFTPDLLGAYTLTLSASDGTASGLDTVVVTAVNTPPVPAITSFAVVNAGEPVAASAAGSTDLNGDPLTFAWTLTGPAGSAATLTSTTGATTSFTTDVQGVYRLQLSASDGVDTSTTSSAVTAYPHLAKLPHDVVAAAYARATDRLVTVSTTPANALWILDPATEQETRVDLASGPPISVGVSADGQAAVVGRNGGVTHVDLTTGAVLGDCVSTWTDNTGTTPVTWNYDAGSVFIGAPVTLGTGKGTRTARFAYTSPGTAPHHGDFAMAIDLGSCAVSSDWLMQSYAFEGTSALRPGSASNQFYVFDYYSYDDFFYVYTAPAGPLATKLTAKAAYYCYQGFWFTDDGGRFICQSGYVYGADATLSGADYYFSRLGSLGDLALGNFQLVTHADHSTARQAVSIVPKNDYGQTDADTVLKRFSAAGASPASYPASAAPDPLPSLAVDGAPYLAHGRYVFYRSDGSKRYVLLRTPPGAATTTFAVAAMEP